MRQAEMETRSDRADGNTEMAEYAQPLAKPRNDPPHVLFFAGIPYQEPLGRSCASVGLPVFAFSLSCKASCHRTLKASFVRIIYHNTTSHRIAPLLDENAQTSNPHNRSRTMQGGHAATGTLELH